MAERDALDAARGGHRPRIDGEDHHVTLLERNDLGAALCARRALNKHEFPAGEVTLGFAQQDCRLQRKLSGAVEVLMQAVVVAGGVFQKQRRRPRLPGRVASFQEPIQIAGIARVDLQQLVPMIGDRCEARIERCAQFGDKRR